MAKSRAIGPSAWMLGGAGLVIGVVAAWLVTQGNPGNMGLCVACFMRDTMSVFGGAGFNMAGTAYIRPELWGIVLGAGVAALVFREFKPRGGSAVLIRFVLGFVFIVSALIFLGCTVRAWLRLGAGDLNALVGVAGIVVGVLAGVFFLKRGFNLGRAHKITGAGKAAGWLLPVTALVLLALTIAMTTGSGVSGLTLTAKGAKKTAEGAVFTPDKVLKPEGATMADGAIVGADGAEISSVESVAAAKGLGGGSRAPLYVSLVAGLAMGIVAQRSRFCTVGGIRDAILVRRYDLLFGVLGLLIGTFVATNVFGTFKLGFEGQPAAHTMQLANFGALAVAALAAVLAGGCPLRQMIMGAEGDADAFTFVAGMAAGALFAHYFNIAATADGITSAGWIALVAMAVVVLGIGFWKSGAKA